MEPADPKAALRRHLDTARQALLWKLESVSEYDVRRPLTPTGTNLLGLVKHLAYVELGYFGDVFDRPHGEPMPWDGDDGDGSEADPNADLYATAEESRDEILALYRRATAHADATIEELGLDATGTVGWWPPDQNPVTLHGILVHLIAETNRHLGHADILREQLDGAVGHRPAVDNLPDADEAWWAAYVDRVEAAALAASEAISP